MDNPTLIIFLVLVFGVIFLLAQLVLDFFYGKKSVNTRNIKQRLDQVAQTEKTDEYSLLRKTYSSNSSTTAQLMTSLPGTLFISQLVNQAGKNYYPNNVKLLILALAVLAGITIGFFTGNILFVLVAALVAGMIPIMTLKNERQKRLDLFEEQLPDALDMITRALRAGSPFVEAMKYIANEMPPPIAQEFGITFEEMNYGRNIKDAFSQFYNRVPSVNLLAVSTAIMIQQETGGNLAELLDKTSDILRKRFRFQRRVKTLTAENMMSAWVLALLPILMLLMLAFTSPDLIKPLINTEMGHLLSGIGIFLELTGIVWVRSQIKFDI